MSKKIKNTYKAFKEVFSHVWYLVLASVFAMIAFVFAVLLPNFALVGKIITTSSLSLIEKIKIVIGLLGGIGTNFSLFSASYTIIISLLFGLNIAMFTYLLRVRRRKVQGKGLAAGLGGVVSGVFGVGCAACGTFLLNTILAYFGLVGALALLSLGGGEFGLLSVILLGVSMVLIGREIAKPLVCDV